MEATILELVDHATSGDSVPLQRLQAVKRVGRQSETNIRILFECILEKLKSKNNKVRTCALELWKSLFEKSSLFRRLGCQKMDLFVNYVVMCRQGNQDYDGDETVRQLRHDGLVSLQQWNEAYGDLLPRIRLTYRYLKSLPEIQFPHIVPDRPSNDVGVSSDGNIGGDDVPEDVVNAIQEFTVRSDHWKILLKELENAQAVLRNIAPVGPPDQESYNVFARKETTQAMSDEEEWEDVPVQESRNKEEGEAVGSDVRLQLLDSYREVTCHTLPMIRSIMEKCKDHIEHRVVSAVMKEAIDMNALMTGACAEYERKLGASARRALSNEQLERKERENGRRSTPVAGPSVARGQVNPMQRIKDPTAPRLTRSAKKLDAGSIRGRIRSDESKSDRKILEKLAKKAPVVPTSGFERIWDSDAPPVYSGSHAMEVSNHWGSVDVHHELPKDRLDALFLIDQSKIRYKESRTLLHEKALADRQGNGGSGPTIGLSAVQKQVLSSSFRTKDSRKAEREYNEEVIRAANVSHLDSLDNLPTQGQRKDGAAVKRRKLPVRDRLAKKLSIRP
jgi:hypothetical protein